MESPRSGRALTRTSFVVCLLLVVAQHATASAAGTPGGAELAGTCDELGDFCIDLASTHLVRAIKDNDVTHATCCDACAAEPACRAYSFEHSSGTCGLFSTGVEHQLAHGTGACTVGTPTTRADQRPNFVFMFPDTLRAEAFGPYGVPVANVTPNVDAFAKSGVTFNQCSPSRCTMFTGRYMHILGHRTQTHLVQDYEDNYFRLLKEAGYHVQYHGKNDAFSRNAFNMSVSNWTGSIGYPSGPNAFTFPEAGYFSFLNTGSSQSGMDPKVSADYKAVVESVEWLHSAPPEPFVIFIPGRGAHPPYGAPKEFNGKFDPDEVKKVMTLRPRNLPNMPTFVGNDNGIPHWRNLTSLPDDFFYRIQATYLEMISYTDWYFGELVKGIDSAPGGIADRTTVFFSSDHGDFGGDYGLVEKWPGSMNDVLTHVPLLARMPGGAKGHVSHAPVQTADVLETMIAMAGINASGWVRFGQSLEEELNGGEGDMSRFVYSEGGFYFPNEQSIEANECLAQCPKGLYCPRGQEEAQPNGSPRATMIRNLTAKLVYRPTGVSELYDLEADPRETSNMFGTPAAAGLQTDLLTKLLDWLVLTSDITPPYVDPRGPPKYPYAAPPDPWAAPLGSTPANPSPEHLLAINGVVEE